MKKLRMSPLQKNIMDMVRRYEGSPIGNIGGILSMEKETDPSLFHRTVRRVQYLNPALRLCVDREGMLYVSDSDEVFFEAVDYSHMTDREIDARIQEWMDTPLFGTDQILVRYYLIRRRRDTLLFGMCHHLVCDGVGLMKVTGELYHLSHDCMHPLWREDVLPDSGYIDYLENLNKQDDAEHREKGLRWFRDMYGEGQPVLPKRRESHSWEAGTFVRRIEGEEYALFSAWLKEQHLSIEQVYEAAFACFYAGITGSSRTVLGRVMINRRKHHLHTAGMFANTLPLVIRIKEGEDFAALCRRIRKTEYEMLRYSDITVHEIKRAGGLSGRLFDTCITYRPTKRLPKNNTQVIREVECSAVEVPLRLMIDEREEEFLLTCKYMKEACSRKEVEALNGILEKIIRAGMRGEDFMSAWRPAGTDNTDTGEKAVGPGQEAVCKCAVGPGQEVICQKNLCGDILESFYEGAARHPARELWRDLSGGTVTSVTYGEAARLTDRIACGILLHLGSFREAEGHGPGDLRGRQPIVGLPLKRTFRMPLALLACLRAGVVFYPVSTEEKNEERLKDLSERTDLMLTDPLMEKWLSREWDERKLSVLPDIRKTAQSRTAYAVSTSGSTGNPKLVRIRRKALNLRLSWMAEQFGLEGLRVLHKTKNTFDVSIWELLLPSMCHGSMVILPDGEERDPALIAEAIGRHGADCVHFVPSMLSVFLTWAEENRESAALLPGLKKVFVSGEQFVPALARRFFGLYPGVRLFNLYGPAECTIDVSFHECRKEEKVIPIGLPVWNTELKIVNDAGEELPPGFIGEIVITGDLVGEGYEGNQRETQERFITFQGQRAYKTGDEGYVMDNGEAVYTGRMDREIKLRGMRVNLTVLEREACEIPHVEGAAAVRADSRLMLFLVTDLPEEEIRSSLSGKIAPHYMPDEICRISRIPCTPNGKCDYRMLLSLAEHPSEKTEEYTKETPTELEKRLLACVEEAVGREPPEIRDNLFRWGMDSLSAAKLSVELERNGYKVRIHELYAAGTVHDLAGMLEKRQSPGRLSSGGAHTPARDCVLRACPGRERREDSQSDCRPLCVLRACPGREQMEEGFLTDERKVVVGIPYAGGGAEIFRETAELLSGSGYLFLAYDPVGRLSSVEEAAEEIRQELSGLTARGIQQLTVISCCVGAALGIELLKRLDSPPEAERRLVLIGSLPAGSLRLFGRKQTLWDILPRGLGEMILFGIGKGETFLTGEMYERLKREAGIYISYFEKQKGERMATRVPTLMIFGGRDLLTMGYRRRYRQWRRYLKGHVRIAEIRDAGHYCLRTHSREVVSLILRD